MPRDGYDQITVTDQTKARFDEQMPDSDTQDIFVNALLDAYDGSEPQDVPANGNGLAGVEDELARLREEVAKTPERIVEDLRSEYR